MKRRQLLGWLLALPFVPVLSAGYKTPEGDQPIEVLDHDGWVEFPFDDLAPGQVMRRKGESQWYHVESYPGDSEYIGPHEVLATAL